jgi:hypothetical protein
MLRDGGVWRRSQRREAQLVLESSIVMFLTLERPRLSKLIILKHSFIFRLDFLQIIRGINVLVSVLHLLRSAQGEWLYLRLIKLIQIKSLLGKLISHFQRTLTFLVITLLVLCLIFDLNLLLSFVIVLRILRTIPQYVLLDLLQGFRRAMRKV